MADPSIATAIAAILEHAINRALRYDPGTRIQLAKLEGSLLAWHCSQPPLSLYFTLCADRLRIEAHSEATADVSLRGNLVDFVKLLMLDKRSLANTDVEVQGKVGLLSEFQGIVAQLDIDWEQALSELIGVVPGHQLAHIIRAGAAWTRERAVALPDALADYLTEELRATPTQCEQAHFFDAVDALRADVERAEARVRQLLANSHTPKK